jgi:hypothetical protein
MSKRRRRLILLAVVALAFLALVVFGKSRVDTMQAEADLLAETGRAAISMFNQVAADMKAGDLDKVLAHYHDEYAATAAGTWIEELATDRDGIRTYNWAVDEPRTFDKTDLAGQIGRLLAPIRTLEISKLKLDRIEDMSDPGATVVRSFLWLRGDRGDGEAFESQALFRMWLARGGDDWKIRRQELLRGSTVVGSRTGFGDVAAEAGIDFVAGFNPRFNNEPSWMLEKFGILKYGSAGTSAADYDGDGWFDLFFADGRKARLFRNQGDTTFRDVTTEVGLPDDLPGVNIAVFADYDNDGDKDVFLGRFTEPNLLFRNDGGLFTDVTEGAGLGRPMVTVAAAGDYDNDGDLDLYLGRYLDPRTELPTTLFYTRNGEGNSLLRNDGDLRFTEVTEEAGVREGGLTLGLGFADYDQDGDQDLYVANDFGRNAMLRNEGDGTFSDVSAETGTHDFGFGMSVHWGDVDNDLDLDIYVSSVHSSQRWYGQSATLSRYLLNSIRQGTILEDWSLYKEIYGYAGDDWKNFGDKMVKGNSLLVNNGGVSFDEVSEIANTNSYGWFWGSGFFDYDNDGRLDIYGANGWISGKSFDDL